MKACALVILLLIGSRSTAQYDIGVSAGLYQPAFTGVDLDAPFGQWTASMFYRERTADRVDLAGELLITSRTLTGQLWPDVHASKVHMQFLGLAAFADIRLINSGNIVIRLGALAGMKLSETFTGTLRTPEQAAPDRVIVEDLQMSRTYFFRNDHRVMAGMGFRIPFGPYMALAIDPYFTLGLNRLFIGDHSGRTNESGLRIGLSRRFHTTGFTNWVMRKARRRPPDPISSPSTPG